MLTGGEPAETRWGPRAAGRSAPFTAARIAAIFAPLGEADQALLAVSGGPDSLAAMLLAAEWQSQGARTRLHVATVDHGLRAEAAAEARFVAERSATLGLPHTILRWTGPKPATRLQEAARDARYALLCDHARAQGIDCLVTAHHADDQAETVLFRLLRGSGIAGLGGMAASVARHGVTHVRPFLGVPKADLVAFCAARGERFVVDPSNDDLAYARARLRREAPAFAAAGLDRDALARLGRRAARADEALTAVAAEVSAGWTHAREPAGFRLAAREVARHPAEIRLRLLGGEIVRLGTTNRLRLDRLESLDERLQRALDAGERYTATLGGVIVRLDGEAILSMVPAPARRQGSAPS